MIKITKSIFKDILLIYKNFFSWTIFKTKTFIFANIFSAIIVSPIILFGLYHIWSNKIEEEKFFNWTFTNDLTLNIVMILVFIVFFISYSYCYIILSKYFLKFLDKKEKPNFNFFKNYFNLKYIRRYLGLFFSFIFIFSFIFLSCTILLISYNNIFGIKMAENIALNNIFSFASIILFLTIIISFYLFYRLIFSFAFMIEKDLTVKKSLKESFLKTKSYKKFFYTIFISFIFLTFYFPFYSTKYSIENEKQNIENYIRLSQSSGNIDDKYIDYFDSLKNKYSKSTNEELQSKYSGLVMISSWPMKELNFLVILYFILFFSLTPLIYISIFKNIINK